MQCTRCKADKPETAEFFPPHNKKKNGLDSWCRQCRSTYRSETRRGHYRSMIDDERLKIIIETTKECVICGVETKLVVDHCHKTNKIRGILCNKCNNGLGLFNDDPELLEYARIYILSAQDSKEADEYIAKNMVCEELDHV